MDRGAKLDPVLLHQPPVPRRLAPGEQPARMQPVALRDSADARSRLQRLGDKRLLLRQAPPPPALNRDDLSSLHRPRSSPSATSRRKPSAPPSKAPSPSAYGARASGSRRA